MNTNKPAVLSRTAGLSAFTMVEVLIAIIISVMVLSGIFIGYNVEANRVNFATYNLAATTTATRQLEQLYSTTWLFTRHSATAFSPTGSITNDMATNLCLPSSLTNVFNCTNHIIISNISTSPPYALIQVSCIWSYNVLGAYTNNVVTYTNTVAALRSPNLPP